MNDKDLRIAIVPGSFDPITNGHIDILRRAAECYDKVYLAVMINATKSYMFSLEERAQIAKIAITDIKNAEVISSDGYLWQLAKSLGAVAIVKGIRNATDEAYELDMAKYNAERYPEAETVLLPTKDDLKDLSSTLVREKLLSGESIEGLLPSAAITKIKEILSSR